MPNVDDPVMGDTVTVVIEVPKASFVKRRPDGSVDFVSVLPCPYNYGSIVGTRGPDGDPLDAVVLGPRLPYGIQVRVRVHGCVSFIDAGVPDPKWVCSAGTVGTSARVGVERFFRIYARFKRLLYRFRPGSGGRTVSLGWTEPES